MFKEYDHEMDTNHSRLPQQGRCLFRVRNTYGPKTVGASGDPEPLARFGDDWVKSDIDR